MARAVKRSGPPGAPANITQDSGPLRDCHRGDQVRRVLRLARPLEVDDPVLEVLLRYGFDRSDQRFGSGRSSREPGGERDQNAGMMRATRAVLCHDLGEVPHVLGEHDVAAG